MIKLTEYVSAEAKKYEYRVKIAGDLPEGFYEKFKISLGMFDVDNCTKPKATPIQSDPHGFPGLKNESITCFDISLNYPANSEQIIALAKRNGVTPANIVVVGKDFNDSINAEIESQQETEARLSTEEYPEPTKEQQAASDAYADGYKAAAAEFANADGAKFEIAGESDQQTDKDLGPEGNESPLSNVKRKSIKDMLK